MRHSPPTVARTVRDEHVKAFATVTIALGDLLLMNKDTSNTLPLTGKIAVVTGGGRGIGQAISFRLSQLGATVVVCGRHREALDTTAERIRQGGGKCEALVMDVTLPESVANTARQISDRVGPCAILVNNAGVRGPRKPLHEVTVEEFDHIMVTNLRGVFLCMRAFIPMMAQAGGGHVINISSIAGRNPLPSGAAYAASKWALNGLSASTAEELRNLGIRVSVISPGSTNSDFDHEGKDRARMLQPENIAELVALLVTQPANMFVSEIVVRPAVKP